MSADVSCHGPENPWNNTKKLKILWLAATGLELQKDSAVQAGKDTKPLKGSTWLIRNVKELKNLDHFGPSWSNRLHDQVMTKSWPSHSKACLNWWLYVGLRHRAPSRDIPPRMWGTWKISRLTLIDSPFLMDISIGKIPISSSANLRAIPT